MDDFNNNLNNESDNKDLNQQETSEKSNYDVMNDTPENNNQNSETNNVNADNMSKNTDNEYNYQNNNQQGNYNNQNNQNNQYGNGGYNNSGNPYINYSPVTPVTNYKPMSKGLKIFAFLMAIIILLSGCCLTGYFFGKNENKNYYKKTTLDLSAKPKKTDEMTSAEIYDKVNPSIVGICVYNTSGAGAQASGVIYSEDGYIITNDHIYSEVPSAKFKIYTSEGKEYNASYVAGDKVSDLAVLKIDEKGFSPADFGNSDELIYGENVVAIGRPNDCTSASIITKGIISATSRRVRSSTNYSSRMIQTDSAINPGSSGGALVNMYGQVVGITSSKIASAEYDAVGYAIPTTIVKRIIEELIKNGKVVTRAKLGITYKAVNSVTAEITDYKTVGLLVASVSEDSDLYGKISENDTITKINDIDITNDSVVLDIIEKCSAGDKITVTVVTKSGNTENFEAVLKANTSESSYTTKASNNPGTESGGNSGNKSNDGTFDFPNGE